MTALKCHCHILITIILSILINQIDCAGGGWDNLDFEIFDAVEEINLNFYQMLQIEPDCDSASIRKAFRRLSLILHPDKNPSPQSESEFRRLVSVYDILKDPIKRAKYDLVLKNGLPNWKSAVYYYRHVRKVGILEMLIILFSLVTVGQYIVGWASYWEAKLELGQKSIPVYPSLMETLPIQIPKFILFLCLNLPGWIKSLKPPEKEPQVDNSQIRLVKKKSKKIKVILPECHYSEVQNETTIGELSTQKETPIGGGLWTDDDLNELSKLTTKYPAGTPNRWDRISEIMLRPISEITQMAAKIQNNPHLFLKTEVEIEEVKKVKTRVKDDVALTTNTDKKVKSKEDIWTQEQQKAFENALVKYPKKSVMDRWDKIANSVGKSKEECISRYKYLVELVVKNKIE